MKFKKLFFRFFFPPIIVTLYYFIKYRCKVSPRAEVDVSSLLKFGRGTQVGSFCKLKVLDGPLTTGINVSIGSCSFISADKAGVILGDYVGVGPNVKIIGNNYKYDKLDIPIFLQEKTSQGIRIGNNVWIGAGCAILDGSDIGDGAIISPNSVVSGKIAKNTVAQGNPAKAIFVRR